MSQYYQINGLKVRVSDHMPNSALRGSSDVDLYVRSACNGLLSVENQIAAVCEQKGYDISDFQDIINDWKDGTYDISAFERVIEEPQPENDIPCDDLSELRFLDAKSKSEQLEGYSLSMYAKHPEIKALSEKTGVSQAFIKKFFNIR